MITFKLHRGLRLASFVVALTINTATLLLPGTAAAQSISPPIACDANTGKAGIYDCDSVDLLAIVPSFELSFALCELLDPSMNPNNPTVGDPDHPVPIPLTGSDMWGWTHTDENGDVREFALQGLSDAVAFIEMTDPVAPIFLGCMTAPTPNFLWRDLKVYNDHMYVVGDFSPELALVPHDHDSGEEGAEDFQHGLQIFDLKHLLTASQTIPVRFYEDAIYQGFDEAHNIVIDEDTGFATAVASDTCGAEFHMLDLTIDPLDPEFLGCFNSGLPGAVHDAQCTIYHGPDKEHKGKEICLAFMEDQFSIFDMTPATIEDPNNPGMYGEPITLASNLAYPGYGYVHQGWFTDDHKYVGSNDELDEVNAAAALSPHNTRTYMWDVQDLDNPIFIAQYEGPTGSIDHNMYFKGIYLHQANYVAGYRVLDATNIAKGELTQVAFFDTHPPDIDGPAFGGVWSGYFYFESGAVALSQLDKGELFILQPDLPEPPVVDDDDFDSDGKRDDEDSDDDSDGIDDDADSDDDNDGKKDDADSDDDNDGIDDEYDSQEANESQQVRSVTSVAGATDESTLAVESASLLLLAAAESANADSLRVEIYSPSGLLLGASTTAFDRALATAVPVGPGDYKIKVVNMSNKTVDYDLVTVTRRAW